MIKGFLLLLLLLLHIASLSLAVKFSCPSFLSRLSKSTKISTVKSFNFQLPTSAEIIITQPQDSNGDETKELQSISVKDSFVFQRSSLMNKIVACIVLPFMYLINIRLGICGTYLFGFYLIKQFCDDIRKEMEKAEKRGDFFTLLFFAIIVIPVGVAMLVPIITIWVVLSTLIIFKT